jgi:hypothetical protein
MKMVNSFVSSHLISIAALPCASQLAFSKSYLFHLKFNPCILILLRCLPVVVVPAQAFTSAATGVISALASKPNVQIPDLSGLFAKPSFNLTLPTISMPTINMPDMVRHGLQAAY